MISKARRNCAVPGGHLQMYLIHKQQGVLHFLSRSGMVKPSGGPFPSFAGLSPFHSYNSGHSGDFEFVKHIVFLHLLDCVKICLASWSMAHPITFTFHHNKLLFANFAACSYASVTPPLPSWVRKLPEGRGQGPPAYLQPVSPTSSGKWCVCHKHANGWTPLQVIC